MDTRYGIPDTDWDKMKDIIRPILVREAKNSSMISYSNLAQELWNAFPSIKLEANSHALADMLGEISMDESDTGHGMLSVVVINEAESRPGEGFFKLARKECGYAEDAENDFIFSEETNKVFDYWKSH